MAKKNLTKEIASALKEGLNFEEFLQKENLTEKDINYIIKPFYEKAYPVFKEIEVKANKYNEIKMDNEWIHVPRSRNHSLIYALLRFDSYQLISIDGEIIHEGLRPYMNKKRNIEWPIILQDWRRKPRAMVYSRYWKYLPERIKLYLNHPDWKEQDYRVNQLLGLLVTHDMLGIDANL